MKTREIMKWVGMLTMGIALWGCAANGAYVGQADNLVAPEVAQTELSEESVPTVVMRHETAPVLSMGWTERTIAEAELLRVSARDPDLSPSAKLTILARLNTRAKYYVDEDIKSGRSLRVPNDFGAFKHWTPMPRYIPELANVPKLVLVVKDIPFIGWYKNGRLTGDSYICIGKKGDWTRAGIYRVLDKDIDHISRSYTNAYGRPAPMPWALRIYEHVWIHAGDIANGYCSHGCINLPLTPAINLFEWADRKTVVVVLESLGELGTVLEANQSNCSLYAYKCGQRRVAVD